MKKIFCFVLLLLVCANAKEELLTLKGSWHYSNALSMRSNYTYNGQDVPNTNYVYGIDSVLGFGAEYIVITRNSGVVNIMPKNMDISLGFNYLFPRNIYHSKITASGKYSFIENYDFTPGSFTVQTTSFYLKSRYFLGYNRLRLSMINTLRYYLSGRLSYNFSTVHGSFEDITRLRNALGWGISFGTILDEQWDAEVLYESFSSNINNSISSPYVLNSASVSVGYLMDANDLLSGLGKMLFGEEK